MKNAFGLIAVSMFVLAGCVAARLTPEGANIKLIKSDPPVACKELGDVSGSPTLGNLERGKINIRNKAATMGANYVRLDMSSSSIDGTKVLGTAFKCPEGALK